LRDALAHVKTLRGFLPICAACKKIRTDEGYWERIETYIEEHSEAEFSHSMCPECLEKYYDKNRPLK
ncbi:MAG: response regulator, partial [Deltaproteobacteria bacterium]